MGSDSRGILYVLSGPSGSGKGTVIRQMLQQDADRFAFSVSATTRSPRPGEIDGKDYFFITRQDFENKIASGEMLEYVEYCGNYYGTPRAPVEETLRQGRYRLLEIEVTGGKNVKRLLPEAVLIFIAPPSIKELRERLTGRGTEDSATIERRLEGARSELGEYVNYDYLALNDTVEQCVGRIGAIMQAEKTATTRMRAFMERVIQHV